jgi:hypothetical protein
MSANHTPSGPEWAAQDVGHGIRIGDIAWVGFGSAYPKETHRANAQLVSAAPDLLEALQNLENDDGKIPDHAWKIVQAAIAKSTGEDAL